jgi:hypothetical protein
MGIKEDLRKTIDNVKDAFSEAGHKANADAEQTERDLGGDALTPGEKVRSVANQAKEETLAGIDRAKQEIRKNT